MIGTRDGFVFVSGGRTFTCRVEEPHGGRLEPWWWFDVSGDRSRYAPFRAVAGDTQSSVQDRMVAYYEERAARRGWTDPRSVESAPPGA